MANFHDLTTLGQVLFARDDLLALGGLGGEFEGGAPLLSSSASRISMYGTTVILEKTSISGTEVNNIANFSGLLIDVSDNLSIMRLQPFTLTEVGATGAWNIDPDVFKWGLIAVSNATGGNTLAWSDGTDWRGYDRTVID